MRNRCDKHHTRVSPMAIYHDIEGEEQHLGLHFTGHSAGLCLCYDSTGSGISI